MPTASDEKLTDCPALLAIRAISGKWKTRVLWLLRERPHHFGDLRRKLPGVSAKVLTAQIQELEAEGLVVRSEERREGLVFAVYNYTAYGRSLIPVLDALGNWGFDHRMRRKAGAGGSNLT